MKSCKVAVDFLLDEIIKLSYLVVFVVEGIKECYDLMPGCTSKVEVLRLWWWVCDGVEEFILPFVKEIIKVM